MKRLLYRRPFLGVLPTVGVTASDIFVSVSVSGPPARITGVYRCRLATLGADSRRQALMVAASEAKRVLRVPDGTPAVLALEVPKPAGKLALNGGWNSFPVTTKAQPNAVSALREAGFTVSRFDAMPVALARFASLGRFDPEGRFDTRGVRVPNIIRHHFKIDLDAAAIGAALRGFGCDPDLIVNQGEMAAATKSASAPD